MKLKSFLLLVVFVAGLVLADTTEVINVVLIGATGNLAQKYLWQSLRNIEHKQEASAALKIWPAGTRAGMQGTIDTILAANVTYAPSGSKQTFLATVGAYHKLSEPSDYTQLNAAIAESNKGKREVGRVVYMSVPPKFFGGIAGEIHTHLRPTEAKAWLKVVVEKPFGVDMTSAHKLSNALFASLQTEEVLLVDHYMGKDMLNGIRDFRVTNPEYLSSSFYKDIARVEVQMVETEDCAGRTGFYSEVGVLRDTMQNHLMMMLSLFIMDMDASVPESKRRNLALQDLESLTVKQLAQYSSYAAQEKQDHVDYHGSPLEKVSGIPTYGSLPSVILVCRF
jgi:hexose-6-phosphate dehydrogenase